MKKITVIGGDNRLKIVKEELQKSGYNVDSIGLLEDDCGDYKGSDIIVLPVPTTKDHINIFTPLTSRKIPLSEIYENTSNEQLILSCNYFFENKKCVDYGALDSYALLNAVPTAEGAIKLAIENTNYTLWKANVLVIGYGRVGKILANRLKAFGADVTVSARKPADFGLLSALGFNYINTEHLNLKPIKYDIIFNTVDAKVIDDKSFKNCRSDLLIDLASASNLNFAAAEECKIRTIKAPGLPGKIAPKTAADILVNTIKYIINSYN
ncbi:MAG: hypothetical protein E7560_04305 [Ruminococcaceae bacterium]|nr:hypothetical protein [Oscillospiraceae bacterium]